MDLKSFFSSGRVADLLLLVMAAEFVGLALRAPRARRRVVVTDLLFALAPGACLTLAMRLALTGAPWPWIAACLTAALPVHIIDLVRRRRQSASMD